MAKVLGWTDDTTACDCCGKSDLSGTFGVETDAGEIVHYGSVCVRRAFNMTAKEFRAKASADAKAAKSAREARARAARVRFQNTAEYRAARVAFDRAHADVKAGRLTCGLPFSDRVGGAADAEAAAKARIAAEFDVSTWEI